MINKLSETLFFNLTDKKYGYSKAIQKVDLHKYIVPEELYMERIGAFKGYKIPMALQVYNYIKDGKIIPAIFDESVDAIGPNIHTDIKFPNSIFNILTIGKDSKPAILVDLSFKGRYDRDNLKKPIYLDIPEIHLFYMCLAGFINLRLAEDPTISTKKEFMQIISSTYSLIFTKIIDNMFPIASASNTDYDKLFMLCSQFCLETMFKLSKEEASKYSIKTVGITNKNDLLASSVYLNDPKLSFNNCDFQNTYPINNFCDIVSKEYTYIKKENFMPKHLVLKTTDRLTKNAMFCIESLTSFITMIVLSKGGLGIFNDSIIKRYLELQSKDPLKEIGTQIL